MAEFITKCPHCSIDLQMQDEWVGMKVECPECQNTFVVPKKKTTQLKKNNTQYDDPPMDFTECFGGIAVLIGIPLLLYWLLDWPRTVFWCSLPVWGVGLLGLAANKRIALAAIVLAGIIYWGWDAHTQVEVPTPEETVKTISSNTADSSSEKSPENPSVRQSVSSNTVDSSSEKSPENPSVRQSVSSNTSHQTHESKISVSVTVKKWISYYGEECKYNCEYRLYADDQLIATKNSTSMIVKFKVKVEKGASLRAEMLVKNGFGGIAQTLEGPVVGSTATANFNGQSITIECLYPPVY